MTTIDRPVPTRSVRVYRAFTRVYPSRFRREYREPMVQLFADRLRDEGSRRAWGTSLRDLTVSAPNEYWESFMNATPQSKLVATAVVTAGAALAAMAFGASSIGLLLMLALVWELHSILRVRGHSFNSAVWWHFVVAGVAVFATIFVVFALPWPESWRSTVPGDLAFYLVVFGIMLSFVLVAVGVLVAMSQVMTRRRGRAAA